MVQLKVFSILKIYWMLTHFNSAMVQLKVCKRKFTAVFPDEFQFRYGTIKSQKFHWTNFPLIKFQFRYGTIKRNDLSVVDTPTG